MNRRLFNLLGAAAAVLIVAVLLLNWLGPQQPSRAAREKLLPAVEAERASIDRILLSSNGKSLIELTREGEQWLLATREGYPANAVKVRSLLDKLSQAEKVEAKTADPARYEKLGVNEASDKALMLNLYARERDVAALIVGNAVQRPEGQFVRVKADAQSWLIDRELGLSRDVSDWLRNDLITLPASQIKQVERLKAQPVQCIQAPCLPVPGEREFVLSKTKPEDNEFTLAPLPAGKQKGAAWLLSGLTDAMNGLVATNVIRQSSLAIDNVTFRFSRYTSFADQIVLLTHISKDGKHYVSLHAETGPAATDEIKQAVAALNQRHAGWWYEISSYKGEGLARDLRALLQDKGAVN